MTSSAIRNPSGERLDTSYHAGLKDTVLLILGHGVTGNKDRPLLVALAEGLVAKGWSCLRFSYSGNGMSDGRFEDSCITKEVADLESIIATVPDYISVVYIGHSMGGAVGVMTAARNIHIRALVTIAGMVHTADFVKREFAGVIPGEGFMWEDEECPLSQNYVDDLNGIGNTLEAAAVVSQPWLLIHGMEDDIIPFQDSRDAFAVATANKQLLEVPGADHVFSEETYPLLVQAIDSWLAKQFA